MNPALPSTWPRLYLPLPFVKGGEVELSLESTHYLLTVLRANAGDPIRLFNGRQGEWVARLGAAPKGKKQGVRLALEENRIEQRPCPDLWLCAAVLKKNHFDFVIQKATELGVSVIQPVLSARTQIREINSERLRAIAIEAAEQSERLDVPEIKEAVTLEKLASLWPQGRTPLICAEFGEAQNVRDCLTQPLSCCALWTGPEGGYTQDELDRLKKLDGAQALRLGPRILRADTAALAGLACWQALCGDWRESALPDR